MGRRSRRKEVVTHSDDHLARDVMVVRGERVYGSIIAMKRRHTKCASHII